MSAYDNDPRVEAVKYTVHGAEGWSLVWLRGDGRWVVSRSNEPDVDYPTLDEAIRSLIGDPR